MFKEFSPIGNNQEDKTPEIKIEPKKLTQKELQERYEGDRRNHLAEELWSKRQQLREGDKNKRKYLLDMLSKFSDSKDGLIKVEQYGAQMKERSPLYEIGVLEQQKKEILDIKERRTLLQRLKYTFLEDPLKDQLTAIIKNIGVQNKVLENIRVNLQKEQEKITSDYSKTSDSLTQQIEELPHTYQANKKYLFEEVKKTNSDSKERVKNTFEAIENGKLSVASLAKESNAVVVHSIPLEIWSMNNTSGNNSEINTEVISSQEKIAIIQNKAPDLSASIISLNKGRDTQRTMYPFALVIDGTIIASYNEDSGTVTKNDTRNKKINENTLQSNPVKEFHVVANNNAGFYGWNETIVHNPKIRAIMIDEVYARDRLKINKGEFSTKDGLEYSLLYAKKHYPDFPVYIRKEDGVIINTNNKPVTIEEIYS